MTDSTRCYKTIRFCKEKFHFGENERLIFHHSLRILDNYGLIQHLLVVGHHLFDEEMSRLNLGDDLGKKMVYMA